MLASNASNGKVYMSYHFSTLLFGPVVLKWKLCVWAMSFCPYLAQSFLDALENLLESDSQKSSRPKTNLTLNNGNLQEKN